ncbi:hypothetical protein SO802_030159 [Lithocarpus litseifolius]|uniref:Uncharacterized protein n=1 Tax=Lithocarpus litseifolius TaxID=425828 RepID=A0AAW2BYH6_9ROSI
MPVFSSLKALWSLTQPPGSHMFLGYIMKSRWKHGRKWWMQFMPKVQSFSANCGMSAVHLIKFINPVGQLQFHRRASPYQIDGEFFCQTGPMAYTRSLEPWKLMKYWMLWSIIAGQHRMPFEQVLTELRFMGHMATSSTNF